MALYPITITNPGAELGAMTGWTDTGLGMSVVSTLPRTGTYHFKGDAGFNQASAGMYQIINIDAAHYAKIDNYEMWLHATGYHYSNESSDTGTIRVITYDGLNGTGNVLDDNTSSTHWGSTYTQLEAATAVTPGARSIRIQVTATNGDFAAPYENYWDDFEAWFDDEPAVSLDTQQLGIYAVASQPAEEARSNQLGVQMVGAAETSNTYHDVKNYMLGAYALVKSFPDRRDLRAWTFPQDDHKFYVIQLGDNGTLVYDKLSQQWADWRSPGYNYWRTNDGTDWEGHNVACDNRSGKIWRIDPLGRLDYETTPITSQVTGGITFRQRTNIPCYSAELAISAGQPITSLPEGSTGITLRTSDNGALDFVDHGEIAAGPFGEQTVIRWYGLGLMKAPGHYFEITDTGYARRIDGLTIEIGGSLDGQ